MLALTYCYFRMNRKAKKNLLGLVFIITLIIVSSTSYAKNTLVAEKGLLIGYGHGYVGGCHNSYKPLLFIYHIGFDAHKLIPSVIPDTQKRLTFYLEPQYNKVIHPASDYEFGLGFGLEYRFNIIKNAMDGYILAGSGFHYISYDSSCQSGGFNFNDNLGAGFYIYITHNSAINLGFRFRHISNADIRMPNEGINSFLFTLGYSVFF